jgi:hypothetical protein
MPPEFLPFNLVGLAAVIVATISIARTARLLTYDDFPPVAAVRFKIQQWLAAGPKRLRWLALTECPFCLAPYLTAGMIFWMWVSDLHWTWWLINGWWAASYVAAIIVARDEQPED